MYQHSRAYFYSLTVTATTLLLLSFAAVAHAQAQAGATIGDAKAPTSSAAPALPNTVNCFDYYHFGSVQANLNTSVVSAVSGVPVTFSGTLSNDNAYPIVDGALYVKVFRTRSADDHNGPDVVDQFMVKDGISIPAKGSVPVSFDWKVPSYAKSGDYQLATFFTVSKKFSLLGLYFTDDVIGNTVSFSVTGEQQSTVAFDKAGATVNGKQYQFAELPPQVGATDPVIVGAKVQNTTDTKQAVAVTWTLAHWDASLADNVFETKTQTVDVPAHGSVPVSITVGDANYPVYDVLGTLTWKDTSSNIGVRFVRAGVDVARINFSGITSYPLLSGKPVSLFSCVHDTGTSGVANSRVDISLIDLAGHLIQNYSYKGLVPSSMTGIADQFTPSSSYDSFILDTKLYSGSTLVDESKQTFDCKAIDPALCVPVSNSTNMFLTIGGVIVLLIVLLRVRKMLHHETPPSVINTNSKAI